LIHIGEMLVLNGDYFVLMAVRN